VTARRREDRGVREARRVADVAAAAWYDHIVPWASSMCTQCSVAASRRRYDALCPAGAVLYQARLDAAAALARERADAARPDPNQAALFDITTQRG
jgi:hypothetical protein